MTDEVPANTIEVKRGDLLEERTALNCEHCQHDAPIICRWLTVDQLSSYKTIEATGETRRRQVQRRCKVAHAHP